MPFLRPLLYALALAFLSIRPACASEHNAVWVYHTDELIRSEAAVADLLEFCRARHIVDLYWDTRFVPGPDKDSLQIRDSAELRAFLRTASEAHLRVHTLSGEPTDVLPGHAAKVLARVEATVRFNEARPGEPQFAGIHLDIEPHAAPSWKTSSDAERTEFLGRLVNVHAQAAGLLHERAPGLLYGADIVFWLGKRKPNGSPVYPVDFNGHTADPETHLLSLVDQLGIMSYRSFAEGKNGLIDLVSATMARGDAAKAQIFVGIKIVNIGPPLETFFGQQEHEIEHAVALVDEAFASHRSYAGIAYFMYPASLPENPGRGPR